MVAGVKRCVGVLLACAHRYDNARYNASGEYINPFAAHEYVIERKLVV